MCNSTTGFGSIKPYMYNVYCKTFQEEPPTMSTVTDKVYEQQTTQRKCNALNNELNTPVNSHVNDTRHI